MRYSLSWFGVRVVALIGMNGVAVTAALGAFPTHTFDANNQGWTIAGSGTDYGPPTIDSEIAVGWDGRGNPGGALYVEDNYYSTWISAPSAFLGNQTDMYGSSFSYDIWIRYTDQTSYPYPSAAIRSGSLTLLYTIATPPLDLWQRRVVTFDPKLWTVDEGLGSPNPGAVATPAQMQTVLSNLQHLYLLTEWRTGPDDTSIDNIGSGLATGLQGDYNQNGVVDAPDYVLWRNALGSVYTQTDYIIWRSQFGRTAAGGAGQDRPPATASAVPEPRAFVIMGIGFVVTLIRRVVRVRVSS
ncbi:MAG: laminin B domain-containing protein [Pirellulales bacterium]